MVQYVFTPWRDRRELLAVRRQLYPGLAAARERRRRPHAGSPPTAGYDDGEEAGTEGASEKPTGAAEDEDEEKGRAIARVALWVHRGHCPHMVESTALLAAAVLSDSAAAGERGGGGGGAAGGYAVRAAYAAAFSR